MMMDDEQDCYVVDVLTVNIFQYNKQFILLKTTFVNDG